MPSAWPPSMIGMWGGSRLDHMLLRKSFGTSGARLFKWRKNWDGLRSPSLHRSGAIGNVDNGMTTDGALVQIWGCRRPRLPEVSRWCTSIRPHVCIPPAIPSSWTSSFHWWRRQGWTEPWLRRNRARDCPARNAEGQLFQGVCVLLESCLEPLAYHVGVTNAGYRRVFEERLQHSNS